MAKKYWPPYERSGPFSKARFDPHAAKEEAQWLANQKRIEVGIWKVSKGTPATTKYLIRPVDPWPKFPGYKHAFYLDSVYPSDYANNPKRKRKRKKKKFIKKAIKRPGALTRTLRKWRILGKTKKVGDLKASQLNRAYAKAKRISKTGMTKKRRAFGTRTMRQINFYRRVLKPASARKRMKVVKRRKTTKRRMAANPRRSRRRS